MPTLLDASYSHHIPFLIHIWHKMRIVSFVPSHLINRTLGRDCCCFFAAVFVAQPDLDLTLDVFVLTSYVHQKTRHTPFSHNGSVALFQHFSDWRGGTARWGLKRGLRPAHREPTGDYRPVANGDSIYCHLTRRWHQGRHVLKHPNMQ